MTFYVPSSTFKDPGPNGRMDRIAPTPLPEETKLDRTDGPARVDRPDVGDHLEQRRPVPPILGLPDDRELGLAPGRALTRYLAPLYVAWRETPVAAPPGPAGP